MMLVLIDPYQTGPVHLHQINDVHLNLGHEKLTEQEKDITLEARATTKLMANNNFTSALMMKDPHVKHAHIEMALQEEKFQSMYSEVIKLIDGDFTPKVTEKMQLLTLQKYYHVLNE